MANATSVPKRPKKAAFVVMCIVSALLLVVNILLVALVPQNFDMINSFLDPGPSEAEMATARSASADMTQQVESEGIILLENKNNALPLAQGTPVNVFGYGSRDTVYGGSGSGGGDSTNNVTVAQGLENAGFSVNPDLVQFYDDHFVERTGVGYTGNNFDINEPPLSEYGDDLIAGAKEYSDVAIFVISRLGGEGAELPMDMTPGSGDTEGTSSGAAGIVGAKGGDAGKHYLELQSVEQEVLDMVEENFDTVIVLVNSTNAMELGFLEDDAVDAALWIGSLGSTGANAVGQVLSGEVNPSGRTTDTFAYAVESAPTFYSVGDFDYTNVTYVNTSPIAASSEPDTYHYVDYVEGIYVGYRFYETRWIDNETGECDEAAYRAAVQYPFGYGLSYTTFDQQITDFTDDGTTITMKVQVTNTGSTAGKTVVQVYDTPPYTVGGIEKSHVNLMAFTKTGLLDPGASETVELSFTHEDMASYDYSGVKAAGGAYVLEAGDYQIKLMNNAHDVIDSRTVTIDRDYIYNDANDGPRSTDGIAAVNRFDDMTNGENVTWVSRADWEGTLPTERMPQTREASQAIIDALTADEVQNNESDPDIVVQDHGLTLADMKGLAYDDPQWQNLLEQVSVDEMSNLVSNGGWCTPAVPSVDKPQFTEIDGPNGLNNIMAGSTGNQYTGQSVLGCTWNQELATEMGKTFAQEAKAMRVSGLYAPGVNIHRSPFGGRNYEYFSEDGVHSGLMAAAEIQGIQSEGVYCYTKHFAINDQETNRDAGGLCTWVNEQAAREIYMKGFELAVKVGKSQGMMAAFNRLGTTNAAESYALLTEVLRNEWGFQGTVITDCIMQLGYINVDRCLRAGCDLQLSLMNLHTPSELTTGTTTGRQVLRQATHNILYTTANSAGLEVSMIPVPVWLYVTVGVVDVALVALCVFYFVRRRRNMKRWKQAQNNA